MIKDDLELVEHSWSLIVPKSESRMDFGAADLGLPMEACSHVKSEPQEYFIARVESCRFAL